MPKVIPIGLQSHYRDSNTWSTAHLLLIYRPDNTVFGFTSASDDVEIDGVVYQSEQGLDITNLVTSAGLSTDNLELSTFNDGSVFTTLEILQGTWRNSMFWIKRYNWRNKNDGTEILMAGTFGNVRVVEDRVIVELRGLQQYFQQTIVSVTSKTCRARLGDTKCRRSLVDLTFNGTVSSVINNQMFIVSDFLQVPDYFGNGEFEWLSGDNVGVSGVIKDFGGGLLTLMLPMYAAIKVGDSIKAIAGCRKRHDRTTSNLGGISDCFDKFDNVLNFQGEAHLPGIDAMTKSPE